MSPMKAKRKKAARHDSIVQGELPFLWPDENGSLNTHRQRGARSSGLLLQHSPRSPRAEVVRASRLLRSQFLSSWLLSKSLIVVGFGKVKGSLFEMWLSAQLETCDYGALTLSSVVEGSVGELGLDGEEVIRLLINSTRVRGPFKSDGEVITLR